jgi:hypothetical protein
MDRYFNCKDNDVHVKLIQEYLFYILLYILQLLILYISNIFYQRILINILNIQM